MKTDFEVNVFLLAAGLGTRLRPLTNKYPKPEVPFLNVPMGLYQFRYLKQLCVKSCVVNSFYLPERIERLYATQAYFQDQILISNETGMILGSAGGLKKAAPLFKSDSTILMMNADEVFFTEDKNFLQQAYQQHRDHDNLATLVVIQHPEAGKKFGGIWAQNHTVKNIGKSNTDSNLKAYHYIGVIFLNPRILSLIPENKETNIFYDILIHELKNNSVEIFNLEICDWYETGNGADYLTATAQVLASLESSPSRAEELLKFINLYDPSHLVQNSGGVSLISDALKITPDALKTMEGKLRGFNVIGGSTNLTGLKALNKIENSILFDDQILNLRYFS